MDLLFILIGAGLAIFVIFVSFKSIGAGIAAKSEINRQKDKLKSGDKEEGIEDITNENIEKTNEQVKIINQIDDLILICLLYTSPSPRDTIRSRMPSSA